MIHVYMFLLAFTVCFKISLPIQIWGQRPLTLYPLIAPLNYYMYVFENIMEKQAFALLEQMLHFSQYLTLLNFFLFANNRK